MTGVFASLRSYPGPRIWTRTGTLPMPRTEDSYRRGGRVPLRRVDVNLFVLELSAKELYGADNVQVGPKSLATTRRGLRLRSCWMPLHVIKELGRWKSEAYMVYTLSVQVGVLDSSTFGRRRRKRWCLRSASEGPADQPGLDEWSGA